MAISTQASTKTRSPNYPPIGLREAIERITTIYGSQQRYEGTRDVIVKLLGYKGLNGASATIVSALSKYGLLEGSGENLRVSELGQDLVLHRSGDPEYTAALKTAAFSPSFFRELHDQYPHGLPSDHAVRANLIKRGFNPKAVDSATRSYRETMEFFEAEAGSAALTPLNIANIVATDNTQMPFSSLSSATYVSRNQRAIQIPLSATEWATLTAAFPISSDEWNQLEAVLKAMRAALVAPEPPMTGQEIDRRKSKDRQCRDP